MLRQDHEAALNELIVACREAAEQYSYDAELLGEAATASLFRDLAAERLGLAEQLESWLRQLGDLPSAPDPEWEVLQHWKDRLQASLSREPPESLLTAREEAERVLEQAVERALDEELPDFMREGLWDMRRLVRLAQKRLADEHASRA